RDGTAGMKKTAMPDFHATIGQDVLEEPAEKLHDVKVHGAETCTAHFPVGERNRAVRQRDDAAGGEGDVEDIRSKGGEGGVTVGLRLTVDVPGDGPDLGGDVL